MFDSRTTRDLLSLFIQKEKTLSILYDISSNKKALCHAKAEIYKNCCKICLQKSQTSKYTLMQYENFYNPILTDPSSSLPLVPYEQKATKE